MGAEQARRDLVKKVKQLLGHLQEIRITKAVIFGSRVRGNHFTRSDLDLILVSEDFAFTPFPERASRIKWDLYWTENYPIEILCYTPEEFARKQNQIGTVRDALKYGIVLEAGDARRG